MDPKHEKTLNKFVKNLKIINKMGTSQLQEVCVCVGGGGGGGPDTSRSVPEKFPTFNPSSKSNISD